MKALEMLPAGEDVGAGGNEIDRIGEALFEVAKMEGLGLSGKADCAEVGCQSRGQERRF